MLTESSREERSLPFEPVPVLPLNGTWSIAPGVNPEPVHRPLMNWTHSSAVSVSGYAVQMDTVNTFDSSDMSIVTSWSNSGFDLANKAYTPTSDLDDGKTWYWRVRAISTTNQLGNWSQTFHFNLPSLVTWNLSSTSAAVEIRHHEAMPLYNFLTLSTHGLLKVALRVSKTIQHPRRSRSVNWEAVITRAHCSRFRSINYRRQATLGSPMPNSRCGHNPDRIPTCKWLCVLFCRPGRLDSTTRPMTVQTTGVLMVDVPLERTLVR